MQDPPSVVRRRHGHLAGRRIGPVTVEAFHAPFYAPALADDAEVFADRIMDRMLEAVGDESKRAAETARYRMRRPRPERGLPHFFESDDQELRIPVAVFLLMKSEGDLVERRRVIAGRQHAVVT